MKKNDIVIIDIEDMTTEGSGIGHAQGMAVFVKDSVIGDRVKAKVMKVKKTYAYARLEELIRDGEGRTLPACPSARACGGCQLQMMTYESQLSFKERRVKNALGRIAGFDEEKLPLLPILYMGDEKQTLPGMPPSRPWRYRNKAQFPVGTGADGEPAAGFYAGRTHSIIPQSDCLLGCPENETIRQIVLSHMKKYGIPPYDEKTGTGLVRHILIRKAFATGQIMTVLVLNGETLHAAQELAGRLAQVPGMTSVQINVNTADTNVILGSRTTCLWGSGRIEDRIGDVRYMISARSFYQVNPLQTRKLYETALAFADLKGDETVWDLYCGIGTISLFLARKAGRVYGVEIIPEAVRDAQENALLNGLSNVMFFEGKAEQVLPDFYAQRREHADVIVVDPPRKGCDAALLETMLAMAPKRIVYVSCDPATLARDLKYLCGGGYRLEKVQPCDMFPQTVHVETVCLLSNTKDLRRNSTT